MAIKTMHKRSVEFSMASMSDLVFLLLIFFILLSTMVSPNAVKLLLPTSNSRTMAKQSVTVYIDPNAQFYVGETPVSEADLSAYIASQIHGEAEASIVLRADQNVAVQYIVKVIDAVNRINDETGTKHKVILATRPASTGQILK